MSAQAQRALRRLWMANAACLGSTDLMYDEEEPELARAVCGVCVAQKPCYDTVMEQERGMPVELRFGVTGGSTPQERVLADETIEDAM